MSSSSSNIPSDYRVVAVAGATGGLGHILSKVLLQAGFQVIVLTRASTASGDASGSSKNEHLEELKKLGAQVTTIQYDSEESMKKALSGVNVVLSTLNGKALDEEQRKLVKAAKGAGVKRFIPSEFGVDTTQPEHAEPFVQLKRSVQDDIKQSGLEYTFVFTGFFMDLIFNPWMGFNLPNQISMVGEGNATVSFTHREDIGRYLVEMLKHPERSRNKSIRVSGDKATLKEAIEMMKETKVFDAQHGKVEHVPRNDVKERLRKASYSADTAVEQLKVMLDEGRAELKDLNNQDFPEVKPIKLRDYFKSLGKH